MQVGGGEFDVHDDGDGGGEFDDDDDGDGGGEFDVDDDGDGGGECDVGSFTLSFIHYQCSRMKTWPLSPISCKM